MKLSHFFIDHPRFATVINIFILVFGLAAAAFLPVAQYPNIVPPTVQIGVLPTVVSLGAI
jgi:multidrug efflux pump subunit AcrB